MDNPLVQVDPGLYIWTIVTFLILVALLAKFAWRPLLEALEQRQDSIRKSLDDARQATQELERRLPPGARVIAHAPDVATGCRMARDAARPGDRILVFGSFLTVGPALEFLGPEFIGL